MIWDFKIVTYLLLQELLATADNIVGFNLILILLSSVAICSTGPVGKYNFYDVKVIIIVKTAQLSPSATPAFSYSISFLPGFGKSQNTCFYALIYKTAFIYYACFSYSFTLICNICKEPVYWPGSCLWYRNKNLTTVKISLLTLWICLYTA